METRQIFLKTVAVSNEDVLLHSRDGLRWFQKPRDLLSYERARPEALQDLAHFRSAIEALARNYHPPAPEERRGPEYDSPEFSLWLAVLEQAILDARGQIAEPDRDPILIQRQAVGWFLSPGRGVGSFLWVAEFFSLDPECVRKKLGLNEGKSEEREHEPDL